MKEKATIYDYVRMCKHFGENCDGCPLENINCFLNEKTTLKQADRINDILLNWCKEHPVKTRQDKFLEMFPNAAKDNDGVIGICPKKIDKTNINAEQCDTTISCGDCRKSYWLAEVEKRVSVKDWLSC